PFRKAKPQAPETTHANQAFPTRKAAPHSPSSVSARLISSLIAIAGQLCLQDQRLDKWLKCYKSPVQRTAHILHRIHAGIDHRTKMLRIVEQEVDRAGQHIAILHNARTAILDETLKGFTEVLDIPSRQYGCPHHRRFQRIMSAFLGQRVTNECNLCELKIKPHLPNRVAQEDIRVGFDWLTGAPACNLEALFSKHSLNG